MKLVQKYIKRFFAGLIILGILAVAALFAIVYFYGDEVKDTLLSQLNNRLETEISVEEIELDPFQNFPRASLRFKKVVSVEKTGLSNRQLINADEVALLFNILDILRGQYTIEKIILHNAFLNLHVDSEGNQNYAVFNAKKQDGGGFELNLQSVRFRNVEVSYLHSSSDQEYLFRIDKGVLRGVFTSNSQDLTFDGDVYFSHLRSGKNTFLKDRELSLFTRISVDRESQKVRFTESTVRLEGIQISSSGEVIYSEGDKTLMLDIHVEKTSLDKVTDLIPSNYLIPFKDYRLKGNVVLNGRITGNFSKNAIPRFDVSFFLEKGNFNYPDGGFQMENMSFTGNFTNGSSSSEKTYHLTIDSLSARTSGGSIFGSVDILDFSRPAIKTTIRTVLPLKTVAHWLALDTIEKVSGNMELDLSFRNRLKTFRQFTVDDFISSQTTGRMVIQDMTLKLKGTDRVFHSISGTFGFNNKDLLVDRFSGNVGQTDFTMQGFFRNILAYAFVPGESLFIDADFYSSRFNLDEILESSKKDESSKPILQFSDRINYRLDVQIDTFLFRKFYSFNNSGKLSQQNKVLKVNNTRIHSMDGNVMINGFINGRDPTLYQVDCRAQFNDVSVNKLFLYFGDFGQTKLTSQHLRGRLDAGVHYKSTLSPRLFVDQKSVYTLADVTITEGELMDYKPLVKLSRYVRGEEFTNVRFSTLKNQIRIENEIIYIPEMDIKSDRMSVTLSGNHTFSNEIDYHIQLLLSDVIARDKTIREDLGDNFVEETNDGNTRLFLSMSGSADDPVVRYDGQAVRNKIASDLKNEKEEFKSLFRKEFGNRKREQASDTIFVNPGGSKDFTVEWEESKPRETSGVKVVKPGNNKRENTSGKKDFIISWEEEQDTINRYR